MVLLAVLLCEVKQMARKKTEIYYETEREYNAREQIIKIANWKEKNSFSAIHDNQLGLIPTWVPNISWRRDETYFKNGRYTVNRDDFHTILIISGIMNNMDIAEEDNRYFDMNMIDLVENNVITPFLLFINGALILWSKLDIIRSDDHFAFRIKDRDREFAVNTVLMLRLPPKIVYGEEYSEDSSKTLFSFDKDGKYTTEKDAKVYIGTNDPNIQIYRTRQKHYGLFDTGVDVHQVLFTENMFFFDKTGWVVIKNLGDMEIVNRNLITVQNGGDIDESLVIIWDKRSNKNESSSMRGINHQFVKKVLNGVENLTNYKIGGFMTKYECAHKKNLPFDTNLNNTISYNFWLDHNKYDQTFQHYSNLKIYEYNNLPKGKCTVLRDVYEGNNYQSFPIIFYCGLAMHDINQQIEYYPDRIVFNNPKEAHPEKQFVPKETVEIVWFKKVINGKYEPKIVNNKIMVADSYIPAEDVIPLVELPSKHLAAVNFTLSEDKKIITLKKNKHFKNKLWLVSRNQFIHKQYRLNGSNMIELGKEFETAYDDNKFMVFADSRFLGSCEYDLIVPTIANQSYIKKKALYLRFKNPTNRIIDVYYCSGLNSSKVAFIGDLLIEEKRVYADTDKQVRFKVPYPFVNYPKEYDSFFVIKNDAYVDKSRYAIDGNFIEFYDKTEYLFKGQRLTFVFPYYRQDWDTDGEIDEEDVAELVYYRHRTKKDTNEIIFDDNGDGIPKNECHVHVFKNTTFITPDRYERDGLKITFKNEIILKDTMVTMVAAVDEVEMEDNNIVLDIFETLVQNDGDKRFAIPSYTDSFFIIYNSLILSPSRYNIEGNEIVMIDNEEYKRGEKLLFVYARHKDEPRNIRGIAKTHFITETITGNVEAEGSEAQMDIDNFMYFGLTEENSMIFVNSTYYEPERYKIQDNKIILLDNTKFLKDVEVVAIFVREEKESKYDLDGDAQDVIVFQDIDVPVRNNDNRYYIPYPQPLFKKDSPFFITIGGSFVPESRYTIDTKTDLVTFDDIRDNFRTGHKVRFTFVHDKFYTHIDKSEKSVTLKAGQKEIDIPTPFNKIVNLNRRMLVVYGGVHLNKERYKVNSKRKKLYLDDLEVKEGDQIHFIFFFTRTNHVGMPSYLPVSGYFRIRKNMIDRNYNKEMMLVFVNGRLVPRSQMVDICNHIHKISADIGCRYNLNILSSSPLISNFKKEYSKGLDEWSESIKNVPII